MTTTTTPTEPTDLTVANTILDQLGRGRFIVMTGARLFVGSANALRFKIAGGRVVIIRLNAFDTYDVEILRLRGVNSTVVGYREHVYADQLRDVFETLTGLRVSL